MELLDTRQVDPLLRAFLAAPEEEAEALLGSLITTHAEPVIRGILGRRAAAMGSETVDLSGEIVLCLIERLRRLRRQGGEEGIRDFRGYVAVVTYNALSSMRRRRVPGGERVGGAEESDLLARLPDPGPDAAASLEQRNRLLLLWREIRELPPRQAAALILNLRDGERRDAVSLLPLTGVATIRDIARTVGMPAERFAALWNQLPLEDAAIAVLLGISRQQVINLRKSARERLVRRMRRL